MYSLIFSHYYIFYQTCKASIFKLSAIILNCSNVVSSGSPSFILKVFLISFGITTLPKSSIRLTTPVAFKTLPPFKFKAFAFSIQKFLIILSIALKGNFYTFFNSGYTDSFLSIFKISLFSGS